MLHVVFKSSRGAQELCEVISDVNGLAPGFLKVCKDVKDSRRPVQRTREGP